jgi:hypothetical protein
MVLGTVRQEGGPQERQPKTFKTKVTQGGTSGLSLLGSDGSLDGQKGGWTSLEAAKGTQGRVGQQL